MSQERSEAVVLRMVDWSETSRIVTFLTPGRGRVACLAAGARRARSAWGALLDTMNRLEVVYHWKDGRSVQRLTDVSLLDSFGAVKGDLSKALYAAVPVEIASRVAQENEPSDALYDVLVRGLEGLCAWPGDPRTHAAWQVVRVMGAAGYAPEVEPPAEGRVSRFDPDRGVASTGSAESRRISAVTHSALYALSRAVERCPALVDAGEAFGVVCAYARRQLDMELRSVRVIQDVYG